MPGRRIDPATGAVTLPIILSTTFERSASANIRWVTAMPAKAIRPGTRSKCVSPTLREVKRRWHFPLDWRWLRR